VRGYEWPELEQWSGLTRIALEAAATVYARADKVIGIYGMGLTQHRLGVETVQLLMNFLLLRGNIGKPGAGICPVRGHSNVQGQRTVGITEEPELVPLDKLAKQFGFKPPRDKGLNTVEACEGILKGEVRGFIGLGGNFVRAIPERGLMEPAWRKLRLTVQIATKLNRSHLIHGEMTYLLPCLGRIEADRQATGPQSVTVEDSTSCIHGSLGMQPPASVHLLSEPAIIAGLAKATLPPNPKLDWDAWVGDYALVRDAIAETYPENFHDFNERMWQPGGFHRHLPARHREWKTETGKANFIVPRGLEADPDAVPESRDVLRLITVRSNDQFNTTIYGYRDRFRGIEGTRMVVLINRNDIDRLELHEGQCVVLVTAADDGVERRLAGLTIVAYDIPEGCCGRYYPECNVLVPLWHHAERAKVPAAKSVPVRIVADDAAAGEPAVPSDMISGSPVSDAGRDVATPAGAAGRAAMRKPVQTVLLTVAAGLAIGAAVKARRGRLQR
jgi:molybdopterin-dependent oxidoreductase alpha subunit